MSSYLAVCPSFTFGRVQNINTSLSHNLIPQTAEETTSPVRKKNEAEVLSPKLTRAATTIAEEAVDQLQASEKLIAGTMDLI